MVTQVSAGLPSLSFTVLLKQSVELAALVTREMSASASDEGSFPVWYGSDLDTSGGAAGGGGGGVRTEAVIGTTVPLMATFWTLSARHGAHAVRARATVIKGAALETRRDNRTMGILLPLEKF